jgi:dTDP-4-dehydrorhamnose reductase
MKTLILGAKGQVGFELVRATAGFGEVLAAERTADAVEGTPLALDLADPVALEARLHELQPEVVINAAAYTAVDQAEDEAELADRINHRAVAAMARYARERKALLVHYSTDYVFGGSGVRPYLEDDPAAPQSVYGRSKWAGEEAIRKADCAHIILRTAWVYGSRGRNFLLTMLRLARTRPELRVVDDQVGCPTTARFLAETTLQMLMRWRDADAAQRAGLQGSFHVVAEGAVSWCGFARQIVADALAAGLLTRAPQVHAIGTGEYPAKAQRPAYSVLSTQKLKERYGLQPPSWRTGLVQCLTELVEARRSLAAIDS